MQMYELSAANSWEESALAAEAATTLVLKMLLREAREEWLERLDEQVVLGVARVELQRIDFQG
jgi:hypothetical protein